MSFDRLICRFALNTSI